MADKMINCQQCGSTLGTNEDYCFTCGTQRQTTWPPPVMFEVIESLPKVTLLTKDHKRESALGLLLGVSSSIILLLGFANLIFYFTPIPHYWIGLKSCGLSIILEVVLYSLLRRVYPVLAGSFIASSVSIIAVLAIIDTVLEAAVVYFDAAGH